MGDRVFPLSPVPRTPLLSFKSCLSLMERSILIPLKVKMLLPPQGKRKKMQKPNGDVTIRPKPIQGTGSTNG
ncbi:MAG: hypothetical protein CMM29_10720 [Rhodospirillaceae bacterium]|nr:hypothetical protein [Rhodospirillaceae bacterium]